MDSRGVAERGRVEVLTPESENPFLGALAAIEDPQSRRHELVEDLAKRALTIARPPEIKPNDEDEVCLRFAANYLRLEYVVEAALLWAADEHATAARRAAARVACSALAVILQARRLAGWKTVKEKLRPIVQAEVFKASLPSWRKQRLEVFVDELAQTLTGLRTGAPSIQASAASPSYDLDLDEDGRRILWKGKPLPVSSDRRFLTITSKPWKLLHALKTKGAPPISMKGAALSRALAGLRCAFGPDAISGRGRELKLTLDLALAPSLASS